MRGRVRLRIPALRGDPALQRALEAGLGGNGVRAVSASACTGTVLILFDPSRPLAEIERRVAEVAARRPEPRSATLADAGPAWHTIDADSALAMLGSGRRGLSAAAARAARRRHGRNALAVLPRRSGFDMLLGQFRSLPVALLAVTAALSLLTGGAFDGIVVLAVIVLNGLVGFVSESWTEQAIASLETGDMPPVRVLRDGAEQLVPAEDLAPGDVVRLRRDDLVPADARIIAADQLTVNEAALTGESVPVAKAANVLTAARAPIADRRNMLFRGSVITGGSGAAVVVATGERTEISRVQALVGSAVRPETPLQQQLDGLGRLLVFGAFGASGLMLLIGLVRGQNLLLMLRSAISLGVAAVPEGLPTMVTTALAVSARRLSRQRLLVRRFEAIEALGTVRLVCFDKTGTLTLNRMSVVRLAWNGHRAIAGADGYTAPDGSPVNCGGDLHLARLVEICILCNDAGPVAEPGERRFEGSSTETALLEMAAGLGLDVDLKRRQRPRLSVVERAEGRRYMVTVHATEDRGRLVAVKGDPEAVLALCHYRAAAGEQRELDAAARADIDRENLAMAASGLRVLGIACRVVPGEQEPAEPASELVWLGLVGMADPIRRGAADLVRTLQRAGIATVMLTGDQRATAAAIAAEAGLAPDGGIEVIEADGLDGVPLAARSHRIFARLTPAQKLQVVSDLQRSGMRVAMIGDGVNDTPALKVADVGITLAASATGVARDVADIVLLGDDLSPLVDAFASGRAVRLNVRRGARFLIATNLSEILLMLFATGTGLARPLTTGQLLWINLLSDVLPAIGLALEPPEADLMAGPLADDGDAMPVMAPGEMAALVKDGGIIAASAVAAEAWAASRRGGGVGATVGFASLMTGQLFYALACRPQPGRLPGTALSGMLGTSAAAGAAALFAPGLRNIAGRRLGFGDLALSAGAGLLPLFFAGGSGGGSGLSGPRPAR